MTVHQDIQRLVYPPKAWAFVKTTSGDILNLTNYIVAGEIKRVLNAPSTARLSLRNPEHLFTTHGNKKASLHPMDPITIYMQRFDGRHVQVFTGYLDTTPYLQLIPGVITIEATCTLKRLMYNYFQLAQQYTLSFFEHFGWKVTAGGVIGPQNQGPFANADKKFRSESIAKWTAEETAKTITHKQREEKETTFDKKEEETAERAAKAIAVQGKTSNTDSPFANPGGRAQVLGDDGSFKKLLWAVLYFMADWKDENIYIEEIPKGVPELIAALWADFNEGERQEELNVLKEYWSSIIGHGSEGSGGGEGNPANQTGEGTGPVSKQIMNFWENHGFSRAAAAGFVGNAAQESTLNPNDAGGGLYQQSGYPKSYGEGTIQQQSSHVMDNLPSSLKSKLKTVTDPKEAARLICNEYEKPLASAANIPHREQAAQEAFDQRGKEGGTTKPSAEGGSESQRSKTGEGTTNKTGGSSKTRLSAMEAEAKAIDEKKYPYSWGGGHPEAGVPSIEQAGKKSGGNEHHLGFDCAGSVGAVLAAGGFVAHKSPIPGSGDFHGLNVPGWAAGEDTSKPSVNVFFNSSHAWMTINGQYFSTGWGSDGAHLGSSDPAQQPSRGDYTVMHLSPASLNETYKGPTPPLLTGGPGSPAQQLVNETEGSTGIMGQATAASFLSQIAAPSQEERILAGSIGGQRALMNARPVLELVEQISQSSLRSFMSLPNGDFYAFYPDYFGEFGNHEPYWYIKNIEIQSGTIELTDNNLVTHYFAIGDVSWPGGASSATKVVNELYAGAMTVFEAFHPGILLGHGSTKTPTKGNEPKGGRALGNEKEAVDFLKRYGARPAVHEYNMVYSALFDQLLAYQQFLLAWSRQFQSEFHFTFMPELFPGGKVAFPEHGIKMFVEEVTHRWSLEGTGFETSALLTAPSVYATKSNAAAVHELPENMVAALIEPLRDHIRKPSAKPVTPSPAPKPGLPTGKGLHKAGF